MKRLVVLLILAIWLLSACGAPPTEVPTPLPTAVPPAEDRPQETGTWAVSFQYEFPPGTLGLGQHRYAILIHCPVVSAEDISSGWHRFEITDEVLPQSEPLYLRMHGLSAEPYNPTTITNDQIHPERPIVAIVHLVGLPQNLAPMVASSCEAITFWDEVGRHPMTPGQPFQP
ncbi:MAG: hypothetical protein PVF47_02355 [Anaerolineae bacterium]|jgi:hypothetical protein